MGALDCLHDFFLPNGAENIHETCPPMNQTLSTPHPDNIMTNDINNSTPRNNAWKYEAKISALKRYVQCELSNLHNKIDRFMETLIRLFQTLKLSLMKFSKTRVLTE